jgi:hypothetical protein
MPVSTREVFRKIKVPGQGETKSLADIARSIAARDPMAWLLDCSDFLGLLASLVNLGLGETSQEIPI